MRLGTLGLVLGAALGASHATAQSDGGLWDPDPIIRTAHMLFDDMPYLEPDLGIIGKCGADLQLMDGIAYCTSTNTLLADPELRNDPGAYYRFAHVFGHAVQVRHGVADIALREIRARPKEEAKLRGWVTRQVECIAGFIHGKSGAEPFDLTAAYDEEPFTGPHWGRNPLSKGPQVSIGSEERQLWFDIGREGDLSACAVEEFGSELLLNALKR